MSIAEKSALSLTVSVPRRCSPVRTSMCCPSLPSTSASKTKISLKSGGGDGFPVGACLCCASSSSITSAAGLERSHRTNSGSRARVIFGPGPWSCSLTSRTALCHRLPKLPMVSASGPGDRVRLLDDGARHVIAADGHDLSDRTAQQAGQRAARRDERPLVPHGGQVVVADVEQEPRS